MKRHKKAHHAAPAPVSVADAPGATLAGAPLLAAACLAVALVELILNVAFAGSGLRGAAPLAARLGYFALAQVALAAVTTAVVLVAGKTGRARYAIVWLAIVLYTASWGTYWNTGTFLDAEALAFWLPNPVQVIHWVYPPLLLGLLALTIVAAAALTAWLPRWVASRQAVMQQRLVRAAAWTAGVAVVTAAAGGLLYGWSDLGRPASPFSQTGGAHAGPVMHALLEFRASPAAQRAADNPNAPINIVRRPIVAMPEYLAGFDPSRASQLNVVMVQIESLRADQLRAYGGTRDVMPTVDAVAREGRVFTKAYVQASHSNYADLVPLASQYPLRSREMYTYPQNPAYPRVLIYDVLKAIGYRTAIVSSQNENWGGMINYHRPSSLDRFFHAQTFNGPTYAPYEDAGFAEWVKQTGGAGSVDDRFTVDEAIRWIDEVRSEPFFLHMNLQSSHLPYVVPAGFRRPFGKDALDFAIMWGKFPLDRIADVKDRYADSLFYSDLQIKRLFDHLRARGLWDRTVIVIGGDNGEAFYEHGFAAHASWLFEEVVRVPMIFRAPRLTAGADDRPAMFLDVPPSIFALLGLRPHPGFQGISLFEPEPDPNRPLFMIAQTPAAYETAMVQGQFKLHFSEREGVFLLHDLRNDPGETADVAASNRGVVDRMRTLLLRWRDEQLDYYRDLDRQRREYPPVIE